MASEKVWKLTYIFFLYMSPITFVALYDSKPKTISKNTAQKHWWFWFQAIFTVFAVVTGVYFILFYNSLFLNSSKFLKPVAFRLGILC